MLSATDVHYLVGLLTLISTPESVEIMLGNLVHDASIDKDRDVDDRKEKTLALNGLMEKYQP